MGDQAEPVESFPLVLELSEGCGLGMEDEGLESKDGDEGNDGCRAAGERVYDDVIG